MDRRTFFAASGSALMAGTAWAATNKLGRAAPLADKRLHDAIARIEASSGGRLGVAMLDTGSGRRFSYRGNERFQMMSTVKLPIAAATLARVQAGKEQLDRRLKVPTGPGWGWSPFTKRRAGSSATIRELCQAATVESDNGAADLLLAAIGAAEALARFLREIGDTVTRIEPGTNQLLQVELGATTPVAMADNAQRLWLGPVLTARHRPQLVDWAVASTTGRPRLRAGLPRAWRAGAKSGTGERGIFNDVAVFWPTGRSPVVVASYLADTRLETDPANAIHARVARALAAAI